MTADVVLRLFLVALKANKLEAADAYYVQLRALVARGERLTIRRSDEIITDVAVTVNPKESGRPPF